MDNSCQAAIPTSTFNEATILKDPIFTIPPQVCDSIILDEPGRHRCHSFDALESVHHITTLNGGNLDYKPCNGVNFQPNPQGYQALIVVCHNLRQELWSCRKQLKLKAEECDKISLVRDQMQMELQDLTASLFEEANKMVQEANIERAACEKRLTESRNKVEMLEAEVNALKTLVITSTPNAPNKSLHTHIMPSNGHSPYPCQHCHHSTVTLNHHSQTDNSASPNIMRGLRFLPGHKRSTSAVDVVKKGTCLAYHSHYRLSQASGKSSSLPLGTAPPKVTPFFEDKATKNGHQSSVSHLNDQCPHHACYMDESGRHHDTSSSRASHEVDPIYFEEFVAWHKEPNSQYVASHGVLNQTAVLPSISDATKFIDRLYNQDILPTLEFSNKELASLVLKSLEENKLVIEALYDREISAPRECSLTQTTKICPYRMKLNENDEWHYIGESTRNRIVSVGDVLSYLRYIEKGLVKSEINETYWEIMKLKKQMALGRFSF